jgi:formylglycine-generating enzyme required for sulfatase activity
MAEPVKSLSHGLALAPPGLPRSMRGRAELLHSLWLAEQHGQVAGGLAAAAGFALVDHAPAQAQAASDEMPSDTKQSVLPGRPGQPGQAQRAANPAQPDPVRAAPLPEHQWAVTERVSLPAASDSDPTAAALPLQLSDLQGQGASPRWQPIVPAARLLPALRRCLPSGRRGGLDIVALIEQLAQGKPLRRLPRRVQRGWTDRLLLVLDMSEPLLPYRNDMQNLAQDLARWLGRANLQVRLIGDSRHPLGAWQAWQGWPAAWDGDASASTGIDSNGWADPACSGQVLLVSELGLASDDVGHTTRGWGQWCETLAKQGANVQVWCPVPLGQAQQDGSLPRLPVLHWSAASNMRVHPLAHAGLHRTEQRIALAGQLCARLASAAWVEPGLLRALRLGLGPDGRDAGLEQLAWDHPAMTRGHSARSVRAASLSGHWAGFAALPVAAQIQAIDTIVAYHRAHNQLLAQVEVLGWASHAKPEACAARADLIEQAHSVLQRLAMAPWQFGQLDKAHVREFMARWVGAADRATRELCSKSMARMWVALHRDKHGDQPLPAALPGLAAADLAQAMGQGGTGQAYWLTLDASTRCLCLQPVQPPRQFLLDQAPVVVSGFSVEIGDSVRWLVAQPGQAVRLARLPWAGAGRVEDDELPLLNGRLILETGREQITVEAVQRPALPILHSLAPRPTWALEWGRDRAGSYALAPNPWGPPVRVAYPRTGYALLRARTPAEGASTSVGTQLPKSKRQRTTARKPNFSISELTLALDDTGPLATLTVQRGNGLHTQTFRYIAPGQFVMGSPEDEPEHDDDEGPQHQVTITEGFWLADTACTQGFWRAVTGLNPSRFHNNKRGGSEHPVEQVSWNMIQPFLQKLQALLLDCHVGLPTEAEWEYACRAGTTTPFVFGNTISPGEANYDGRRPYDGGEPGQDRDKTVAVKDRPKNTWGLYQMHGNVWEWCADKFRTYEVGEVRDPGLDEVWQPTLEGGAMRALRGGGWINDARDLRAACRNHVPPSWRGDDAGFRLVLRVASLAV